MKKLNVLYGIKLRLQNLLIFTLSLLTAGCLMPPPLYIEPVGDNTATLTIDNKTLDEGRFSFFVYENSKTCTGRSQFDHTRTFLGTDKSIRKQVVIIIPARKDFTFEIQAYLDRTIRTCYMYGTFNAGKGKTYIATLKNRGFCSVSLTEQLEGSDRLIPVKSFVPRQG